MPSTGARSCATAAASAAYSGGALAEPRRMRGEGSRFGNSIERVLAAGGVASVEDGGGELSGFGGKGPGGEGRPDART